MPFFFKKLKRSMGVLYNKSSLPNTYVYRLGDVASPLMSQINDKRQWSPLSNTTNAASNSPQVGLMNDFTRLRSPIRLFATEP